MSDRTEPDPRREVRDRLHAIETWCERAAEGRCTALEALDAIDALSVATRPWAA